MTNPLVAGLCLAVFVCLHTAAHADCSEDRVKSMAKSGTTPRKIAATCRMALDDVKEILEAGEEPEPDKDPVPRDGLPPGTPLGQCGCWGATGGGREPDTRCASGYHTVQSCGVVCPLGGSAWRGVCSR